MLKILDVALIPNVGGTLSVDHDNLIKDWSNRGNRNGYNPYIGMNFLRRGRTSCSTDYCNDCGSTEFVFVIDHKESVFVHAFLFVLQTTPLPRVEPYTEPLVRNFDIYVGDSPNYNENTLIGNFSSDDTCGAEVWANTQGRYIHMVAANLSSTWEVVICSVGTFGTVYERENSPPTVKPVIRGF